MPPTPTTQRMGELHEEHTAEVLGGRKTKASGSQWTDPADGAHHHDDLFAFRWDGKSTKGKSISVTIDMLEKIIEQAGGERPALPLRWYGNDALTEVLHDWIAVKDVDFSELLAAAKAWAKVLRRLNNPGADPGEVAEMALSARDKETALGRLSEELELLQAEMGPLRTRLGQAEEWKVAHLQVQAGGIENTPAVPGYIPMLPWTVIHSVHTAGTVKNSGLDYNAQGHQRTFDVESVRVERSPNSANRPRLIVNDLRVMRGALYVDGVLRTLVCRDNREIEVG
jgi:hypothetical protein